MKIPAQSKPGAGFEVRTATRIAGVGAMGYGGGRSAIPVNPGAVALGAAFPDPHDPDLLASWGRPWRSSTSQVIDVGPGAGSEVAVTSRTPLELPAPEAPRQAFTPLPAVALIPDTGSGPGIQVGDYQVPWAWLLAGAGVAWLAFKKR